MWFRRLRAAALAGIILCAVSVPIEPIEAQDTDDAEEATEPVTLSTARRLATDRFEGWTYGSDATKQQIDCVQFLRAVVEELSADELDDKVVTRILISDVAMNELAALVEDGDQRIRGIQTALTESNLGEEVALNDAQPGDFIQYWIKGSDRAWVGHAALIETIETVDGERRAAIYGAHASSKGIATSTYRVRLVTSASRRIYLARWQG